MFVAWSISAHLTGFNSLIRACFKKRPRGIFAYTGNRYDDGRKDLKLSINEHFLLSLDILNKAVFSNHEQNKSLNIHVYNNQMEDIAEVKRLQSGDTTDTTAPPKKDTTPTTDNVGPRPDDPVQGRRWDNKYAGKYDPETGDKLPEKEKKLPPRMEQNR